MHTDTTRKNGVVSTFLFYWCKGNALYGFGLKIKVCGFAYAYSKAHFERKRPNIKENGLRRSI